MNIFHLSGRPLPSISPGLHLLLDSLDIRQNKRIILARDFNLLLDTTLEIKRGSPCSKKRYIAELIIIKETFDLCNNWRIRNPDAKQFTFRQKHVSYFTQGRGSLDFFLFQIVFK